MSGWSMAQFLKAPEIGSGDLKAFLLANAERVKANAKAMAEKDDFRRDGPAGQIQRAATPCETQ